ncbi:MAG: DUF2927 domain-containing protein [Paracoccaceae bacterium]
MRRVVLCAALLLASCAPPGDEIASRAATGDAALPQMRSFTAADPEPPRRANADIARDFMDLAFRLESGKRLPVFTRFEGPVSVRLTGRPSPGLRADLRRLLARLRDEAGLDIRLVRTGEADITVESVPGARIRRELPQAACFVVPNVSSLKEYRRMRRSTAISWSELRSRQRAAVFLPSDVSPQEARDCLHEELAQALGPLNDLYRLPDSVFNDDNVHTVLTGFDMLILRAYYDPALRNGMRAEQVAARLPAILARLNPRGEGRARNPLPATPRAWIDAIQTALGPGATPAARRRAAQEAVRIARSEGWRDHRLAFSHFALGRITQSIDPGLARAQFQAADRIHADDPRGALHRAYVSAQLAAYALSEGDATQALALTERALPAATRHENAMLMSTLMMLRAEALELSGQRADAAAVRVDSLGWARYGFGADWAVRAKLREIASLNPLNREG